MRFPVITRRVRLLALGSIALAAPLFLHAQGRGSQEWTTSGHDAQRTGSIADARLTKAAVSGGQFKFLWKEKFDNHTHELNALTSPVLLDLLIGYRGFKTLAFVGGSDDRVFAIDTDLARPYWTTVLNYSAATGGRPLASLECPGGLIAAPSRRTALAPPAGRLGGGGGRGGQLGSAVGEAGKGAAVLARMAAQGARGAPGARGGAGTPGLPAGARSAEAGPRRAVAAVPFGGVDPLFVMGSDGLLHTLRVSNGADVEPPIQFVPPDAKPSSLIWVDGTVYTTTSGGCGAAPNALWAVDLTAPEKERKAVSWNTGEASIAGDPGVALGPDGTIYVALGKSSKGSAAKYADSVVALDSATLQPKDWFTAPGADFGTSPVVFRSKERQLVAVAGNDGKLYLLDGSSLGGSDHKTPLAVSAKYSGSGAGGALATWEDGDTRWIAAAATAASTPQGNGRIVAFKVADSGGSVSLQSGWQSRPLVSALAPIVVNGMVFAVSSGEYRPAAATAHFSAAQIAQRSTPAVLYVLDGASGKTLWTSGTTMTSFARGGLAAGGGQVYVVTYDNHLYAFGIAMEH